MSKKFCITFFLLIIIIATVLSVLYVKEDGQAFKGANKKLVIKVPKKVKKSYKKIFKGLKVK